MMLPNPPLVSNSKMDNVFSTGTASAKFSCATDRYLFVIIYYTNFLYYGNANIL
jgi:hypothetical protein